LSDNEAVSSEEKAAGSSCSGCRKLEHRIEKLEKENFELRKRLDEAQRAGKRQAAPFSKGDPKEKPKKPGRKPGSQYGKQHSRPRPEKVDKVIDVPLGASSCPKCGGGLGNEEVHEQFVSDIPPILPVVTQFNVHCAHCKECGHRVQGRHPEQISDALGAAGNQIGPQAISLGVQLNKSTGAPYGKISRFFKDAFGLSVGRSTLLRAFLRTAKKAEPIYEKIGIAVRESRLVYPDETGWKVGGLLEWLWVFVAPRAKAALYVIEPSRGFDVIEAALGSDYSGFLGRDGWAPYDRLKRATHQLCIEHLIRRTKRLEELNFGNALRFPRDLRDILQEALSLRDERDEGKLSRRTFLTRKRRLRTDLDCLVVGTYSNDENRKLAQHVLDHRDSIFSFLSHPELEATNWPAEQAIRPAVVNRKMCGGGNRSRRGAKAQAVLTSVLRTAWQRGLDSVKLIVELLRSRDPRAFASVALGP
jgi:transposase